MHFLRHSNSFNTHLKKYCSEGLLLESFNRQFTSCSRILNFFLFKSSSKKTNPLKNGIEIMYEPFKWYSLKDLGS